jgi:hypothetical protein
MLYRFITRTAANQEAGFGGVELGSNAVNLDPAARASFRSTGRSGNDMLLQNEANICLNINDLRNPFWLVRSLVAV